MHMSSHFLDPHQRLGHAVALRAIQRRWFRHQSEVAGKAAVVAGHVAVPVVGQLRDRARQLVTIPKQCSAPTTTRSRASSPAMHAVAATSVIAARLQQSSAKATHTRLPFSAAITSLSKH